MELSRRPQIASSVCDLYIRLAVCRSVGLPVCPFPYLFQFLFFNKLFGLVIRSFKFFPCRLVFLLRAFAMNHVLFT